jgi:hypothetical protein
MSVQQYDREIAELNGEIRALFDLAEEFSKRYQEAINRREALIVSQIPL